VISELSCLIFDAKPGSNPLPGFCMVAGVSTAAKTAISGAEFAAVKLRPQISDE